MRKQFVKYLIEFAEQNDKIMLLTADIGYGVLEPFRDRFPNRFINCGVAEQNMVGLSVGLASLGFEPWLYSIATFLLYRPFEFIRDGIVYHQSRVRLVGVGKDKEYGPCGFTHWNAIDKKLMELIGMRTYAPTNEEKLKRMMTVLKDLKGPAYMRLRRND